MIFYFGSHKYINIRGFLLETKAIGTPRSVNYEGANFKTRAAKHNQTYTAITPQILPIYNQLNRLTKRKLLK